MPKSKSMSRPRNTGTLENIGQGRWRLRVFVGRDPVTGQQRRKSKTFAGPKRLAEEELSKMQVAHGSALTEHSDITIGEIVFAWFEATKEGMSPQGRRNTRYVVDGRVQPVADLKVADLKPSDLKKFYTALGAEGLAKATVQRIHGTIRTALNWALEEGLVESNPAALVRGVAKDLPQIKRDKIPTKRQISDVINNVSDPWFADLVRLAVLTGARRGEIAALRWSDITDGNGFSTVTFSQRVSDSEIVQGLKAGDEKRIKIRSDVIDDIRANARDETYVFGSGKETFIHPNTISRKFKLARDYAGVSKEFTFHSLRHYCASTLLSGGMDAVRVAKHLGHANPTTTLTIYAHVLDPESSETAEAMSDAFLPERPAEKFQLDSPILNELAKDGWRVTATTEDEDETQGISAVKLQRRAKKRPR